MSTRLVAFANSVVGIQTLCEKGEGLLEFLLLNISLVQDVEPHITFFLDWDSDRQEFQLDIPDVHCYRSQSDAITGVYLMDRLGYHLADRSQGGLLLHAACVGLDGKGILLVGGTRVGKSSLAAHLVMQGCAYLTDELSFLPLGGMTCQGFARPIYLKTGSRGLFSEELQAAEKTSFLLSAEQGCLLHPQGVGAAALAEIEIACILFPQYLSEQPLSWTGLSKAQAGFTLMQHWINARNLPEEGFKEVARLATSLPAFMVQYGSFEGLYEKINHFIFGL